MCAWNLKVYHCKNFTVASYLFIFANYALKTEGTKAKPLWMIRINWFRTLFPSVAAHQEQPVRGKFCFSLLDLIIRVGFMNNIYGTRMSAARVMDYLDPQMLWKMLIWLVQAHRSIDSLQFHFNFILYKTDFTLFMELKSNLVGLLAEFPSAFDY